MFFWEIRMTLRDVMMTFVEVVCRPSTPECVKVWRNQKYLAEGKKRKATHVVTVWDSTDMEVVNQVYVMPGEDVEALRKHINSGPFSVGEVLTII